MEVRLTERVVLERAAGTNSGVYSEEALVDGSSDHENVALESMIHNWFYI